MYAGKDLTEKDYRELKHSFERLPQGVQNEVEVIEIYSDRGKGFTVGDLEYHEGAHWSARDKAIRIFGVNKEAWWKIHFQNTDAQLVHEAGHALYNKFENTVEKDVPVGRFMKIHDATLRTLQKKQDELTKQYKKPIDEKHKRLMDLHEENYAAFGDNVKRSVIKKKLTQAKRALTHLTREHQKKADALHTKFDPQEVAERGIIKLKKKLSPVSLKLSTFAQAGREEGGITPYSQSYYKANKPTQHTENFAECMKVFYSGATTMNEAKEYRQKYPKTFHAFRELIEPEIEGHYVTFKYRPLTKGGPG